MKKAVEKVERGEEVDPVIKYKIITEGWNIRENQILVWEYVMNRKPFAELIEIVPRGHRKIKEILQQMKIPTRTKSESLREPRLDKKNIEQIDNLVLGTLLGDASVEKTKGNSYACKYTHVNTKKDYNEWIQKQLEKANIKQKTHVKEFEKENWNPQYIIKTRKYPYFYRLRQEWYPEGIKIVPKSLELNPEIILYWYLDDGCLGQWGIRLCTNAFDKKSDQHLQQELYRKFGILSKRQYLKEQDNYCLRLNKKERKKFLKIIIPEYEKIDVIEFDYKFKA